MHGHVPRLDECLQSLNRVFRHTVCSDKRQTYGLYSHGLHGYALYDPSYDLHGCARINMRTSAILVTAYNGKACAVMSPVQLWRIWPWPIYLGMRAHANANERMLVVIAY